ncbi:MULTISPECIES: hypothetical protein [Deferrisoma]
MLRERGGTTPNPGAYSRRARRQGSRGDTRREAGALHLALGVAGRARGFATFDRAFARTAEGLAPLPVFEP